MAAQVQPGANMGCLWSIFLPCLYSFRSAVVRSRAWITSMGSKAASDAL